MVDADALGLVQEPVAHPASRVAVSGMGLPGAISCHLSCIFSVHLMARFKMSDGFAPGGVARARSALADGANLAHPRTSDRSRSLHVSILLTEDPSK
jgi:hypothetical protein